MKKMLVIILCIFFITTIHAFEKGTKNIGGSVSFQSTKYHPDADAQTLFSFTPHGGYFFSDNFCTDFLVNFVKIDNGYNYTVSDFAVGFGGRYFFNSAYAGAGFMMLISSYDNDSYKSEVSRNYLNFQAGYLVSIVKNVYADLGLDYQIGIGQYGLDGSGDNESSTLNLGIGIDVFFK